LIWFCSLAPGSFLVSWIFSDLLHFNRAAYVSVFAVATVACLYGYFHWNNIDWGAFISHQWLWWLIVATAAGIVVIILLAWLVRWQSLSLLPPPGPQGMRFVNLLLVNGVVNGAWEPSFTESMCRSISNSGWCQGAPKRLATTFDAYGI